MTRTTIAAALTMAGALAFGTLSPTASAAEGKNDKSEKSEKTSASGKAGKSHHAKEGRDHDNTGVNKRDRDSEEVTAEKQTSKKSDEDLTVAIRRALTDDKSLSFDARNVKVVTRDGKVTVKGPVASAEEKRAVEAHAHKVAGAGAVTSELEVKQK